MTGQAVTRTARHSKHWHAWNCDHDRLLRLARRMGDCADYARRLASSADADNQAVASEQDYAVRLEARHRDLSMATVGPPAEVLKDLDATGLEALAVTLGRPPRTVAAMAHHFAELPGVDSVPADRAGEPPFFAAVTLSVRRGASVYVFGRDPAWVRHTRSELEDEISKALPPWRFLRSMHMWWPYAGLALLALALALKPTLGNPVWLWVLLSVVGAIALATGVLTGIRRLLPGFEIVTSGSRTKAWAVLAVIGGLLSQVGLGVLVNKITG